MSCWTILSHADYIQTHISSAVGPNPSLCHGSLNVLTLDHQSSRQDANLVISMREAHCEQRLRITVFVSESAMACSIRSSNGLTCRLPWSERASMSCFEGSHWQSSKCFHHGRPARCHSKCPSIDPLDRTFALMTPSTHNCTLVRVRLNMLSVKFFEIEAQLYACELGEKRPSDFRPFCDIVDQFFAVC